MLNFRGYKDLADVIHKNLSRIAIEGFDLVVGVPRSGMIPAYMIALDLNIAVCTLDDLIHDRPIKKLSMTRQTRSKLKTPKDATKVLIVDDSYSTGLTASTLVSSLPPAIQAKSTIMAIYSAVNKPKIDMHLEVLPQPRVFEWNIFHHEWALWHSCFDLDGVLCEDPSEEQNDDGKKYLDFVRNARPKYLPTQSIRTIVTSRLEKYRPETVSWLKKHGVEYERLVMLSGYTAEERRKKGVHAVFKAQEYRNDEYSLFVESNHHQAEKIVGLTGKPVYCIDSNVMLFPTARRPRLRHRLKESVKRQEVLRRLLLPSYKLYLAARKRLQ